MLRGWVNGGEGPLNFMKAGAAWGALHPSRPARLAAILLRHLPLQCKGQILLLACPPCPSGGGCTCKGLWRVQTDPFRPDPVPRLPACLSSRMLSFLSELFLFIYAGFGSWSTSLWQHSIYTKVGGA